MKTGDIGTVTNTDSYNIEFEEYSAGVGMSFTYPNFELVVGFKSGDRVRILDTQNVRSFKAQSSIGKEFEYTSGSLFPFNNRYNCNYRDSDLELVESKGEETNVELQSSSARSEAKMKMELKDIKKVNLKEAKKQVLADKANAEVLAAKEAYSHALDRIDYMDRQIKQYTDRKVKHQEVLDSFK